MGVPSVLLLEDSAAPQVTLRSQGGSDQRMIHAQQQNADARGLTILEPIYIVESAVETGNISFQIALPIPPERNGDEDGVAMFQWDSQFQQWRPLNATRNHDLFEATVDRFGSYALLIDRMPPMISAIFSQRFFSGSA